MLSRGGRVAHIDIHHGAFFFFSTLRFDGRPWDWANGMAAKSIAPERRAFITAVASAVCTYSIDWMRTDAGSKYFGFFTKVIFSLGRNEETMNGPAPIGRRHRSAPDAIAAG